MSFVNLPWFCKHTPSALLHLRVFSLLSSLSKPAMSGQLVGQIANREVKETLADTGPVFVQETFETWLTMWYTLQKASSTVTEFSDWIADVNAEGLQMLSQIRGYGRICYFHFDGFPAPSSWESIAARLLPGMTPQQRTAAFSEMTYEVLHFVCDKLQTISKALVTIAVAKSRTKKTQWTKLQKWVMKDGKVKTGDDTHLSNINQWLYTEGTVEKKTLDLYLVEIEKIATALKSLREEIERYQGKWFLSLTRLC